MSSGPATFSAEGTSGARRRAVLASARVEGGGAGHRTGHSLHATFYKAKSSSATTLASSNIPTGSSRSSPSPARQEVKSA
jgi:hypothetical protein